MFMLRSLFLDAEGTFNSIHLISRLYAGFILMLQLMRQLLRLDPGEVGSENTRGWTARCDRGEPSGGGHSLALPSLQLDGTAAPLEFHSLKGDVYCYSANEAKKRDIVGVSVNEVKH